MGSNDMDLKNSVFSLDCKITAILRQSGFKVAKDSVRILLSRDVVRPNSLRLTVDFKLPKDD